MEIKLNMKKLKEMQAEMDKKAAETHDLDMGSRLWFENRITALIGELYEVLAVVETFKDWKINKGKVDTKRFVVVDDEQETTASINHKIDLNTNEQVENEQALHLTLVEECSDCLHFLLTIINYVDIDDVYLKNYSMIDGNVAELFKIASRKLVDLQDRVILDDMTVNANTKMAVMSLIDVVFSYFDKLGVTQDELEQAYYDKHEINEERLKEGY